MPTRIAGSNASPDLQTRADQKDLGAIRDRMVNLFNDKGALGAQDARSLLNEANRDGRLTMKEVGFLAESFRQNAHVFTPEAAQVMNEFLTQHSQSPIAPQNEVAQGWTPNDPQSKQDVRDLGGIRDRMVSLYNKKGALGPGDAQAIINEATRDGKLTRAEVGFLAESYRTNAQIFTPEAANVMVQFLQQNTPAQIPTGRPPAGDGFDTGFARAPTKSEIKQLTAIRDRLVSMMTSGEVVTGREMKSLLKDATRNGPLDSQTANLLAQGARDNAARFSPEALQLLLQTVQNAGL